MNTLLVKTFVNFILKYYKWGDKENCLKSRDIPFTSAQSQEVYVSETNDVNVKCYQRNKSRFKIPSYKKFEKTDNLLTYQIKGNIDILIITETKLGENFPIGQFFINGFSSPFRLDRDRNDSGILLHIREDVPSRL